MLIERVALRSVTYKFSCQKGQFRFRGRLTTAALQLIDGSLGAHLPADNELRNLFWGHVWGHERRSVDIERSIHAVLEG